MCNSGCMTNLKGELQLRGLLHSFFSLSKELTTASSISQPSISSFIAVSAKRGVSDGDCLEDERGKGEQWDGGSRDGIGAEIDGGASSEEPFEGEILEGGRLLSLVFCILLALH